MSTETPTREQRQADFNIVTSEQPDIIRRALDMDGVKDKTVVDANDSSALDKDGKLITAKSGDDSDSSVDAGAGDDTTTSSDDSNTDNDPDDDPDSYIDPDDDADDAQSRDRTADGKFKKRKSSGIEKRFSKLSAQIVESNRINAELLKRVEAAEKAAKPAEVKPDSKVTAATDTVERFTAKSAPEESSFATYGEFVAATSKWAKEAVEAADTHAEKRAAKLVSDAVSTLKSEWIAEQAKSKAESDAKTVIATYESRKAIVAADPLNKDFDQLVTQNVNKVMLTDTMRDEVLLDPKGPEIALYFGRNPKEAVRIATLTVKDQLKEIGSIIAKLSAPAPKPAKTATAGGTGTRRPAEPLPRGSQAGGRGTGTGSTRRNADQLSADDYIAQRRAGTLK